MKNVSKSKFLTCFRPVVDIDTIAMLDSKSPVDRHASRRLTDKHDAKSMFSEQEECSKTTQNHVARQPSKRAFAKVIKAVVFETILTTRARNKKLYSQSCFGSKGSYSVHADRDSSSTGNGKSTMSLASLDSNVKEIKTTELSLSSSPSSSRVSEYKSSEDQLEKQNKCLFQGICMILISLAVTVFGGKITVIILTSVLFCFFSVWNRLKEAAKLWNTDSKASKNRYHHGRMGSERNFSNGH